MTSQKAGKKLRQSFFSSKLPGFTLIEILIASTIFALVMILATASMSQTTNFQGKIRESRLTSETARKIADMMSEDIRGAKGGDLATAGLKFSKGIAMFHCSKVGTNLSSCGIKNNLTASTNLSVSDVNTLVIMNSSSYKVYFWGSNIVFYKIVNSASSVDLSTINFNDSNIISSGCDTAILATGFGPSNNSTDKQQAFVQYQVESRTIDYDHQPETARAVATIKTTVASRNYD